MKNFKINAQVCIFSLADPNAGHCVELTFLDNGQGSLSIWNRYIPQ